MSKQLYLSKTWGWAPWSGTSRAGFGIITELVSAVKNDVPPLLDSIKSIHSWEIPKWTGHSIRDEDPTDHTNQIGIFKK